ncbi:MAG: hypothetical protein EBR82_00160 [Caulobacteraceae bacterium]|nr:hypothetical protein [Caulobacteraceae bacterium]
MRPLWLVAVYTDNSILSPMVSCFVAVHILICMNYVYVITCLVNGKQYVGKTKDPESRKKGHFVADQHRKSFRQVVHAAIHKHGVENFTFEVVSEHESEAEAFAEEHRLIKQKLSEGIILYNMNEGGAGGINPTKETREKMSKARLGIKLSEETKKKISEAAKRQFSNPEAKAKLAEQTRSRWGAYSEEEKALRIERLAACHRGKKRIISEETKKKISNSLIERADKAGRSHNNTEEFSYNCKDCNKIVTKIKIVTRKPPRVNGLCKSCNSKRMWASRKLKQLDQTKGGLCDCEESLEK